jgi:hypothetical protein
MWGKRNPCTLLVGMQASASILEKNLEASKKSKHRSAIWSSHPTSGDIPKECDTGCSKSTCTPMFIAALFTIDKVWKQPRCPTTDKGIKKIWYLYTVEFYLWRRMKSYHLQANGWNWRISFWAWLARLRRPKIIYSPSYAGFRSSTNTAMLLALVHMTRGGHIQEI